MEYKGPHRQQTSERLEHLKGKQEFIWYLSPQSNILYLRNDKDYYSLLTTYRIGNMNNNIHVSCLKKPYRNLSCLLQYGIDKRVSGSDKIQ